MLKRHAKEFAIFEESQLARGIDITAVKSALKAQRVELPSWAFADSGTRFGTFHQPGAAKTLWDKLDDAAQVHRVTGVCPSVALHIPWDRVDDWSKVASCAAKCGQRIGAINPNLFQEECYKFGSLCNPDAGVRRRAVAHVMECVEIARTTGSGAISLWLADGSNFPGQDSMVERKRRLEDSLRGVMRKMPRDMRLLIEYKFFEPAFYHTDLADWGMAYSLAMKLGPRAQVLIDLGHHPQGTNIEQIVAFLLDEGKMGGFHFNNRKYGDDDLTVGSINPYEMFLVYNELVAAAADPKTAKCAANVAYMFDHCHNLKPPIEAMIQSVMNVQTFYAQALLVNRRGLAAARREGRIVDAEQELIDAFRTDVRPLLAQVRLEMGIDPEPLKAHRKSGYLKAIAEKRG